MILPVTTLAVVVAALLLVALSLPVSLRRAAWGAGLGDAGDPGLTRRIRAQGNFIEYVPLGLMLIALIELSGNQLAAIVVASILLAARLLHAAGMYADKLALRGLASILTYLALLSGVAVLALGYWLAWSGK